MNVQLTELADGDLSPVLVVEFLSFAAAKPVSTVLARHNCGHPVYRMDPVGDLARAPGYRGIPSLADAYANQARSAGLACRMPIVVGYCSAAVLAWRLAEQIGDRIDVVIVQPTWPTVGTVREDFASFRAQWAADPAAIPDPPADVSSAVDPAALLDRMTAILAEEVTSSARSRGLDGPDAVALTRDLLDRYRGWLGFSLATADHLRAADVPSCRPRVLAGRDEPMGLPWPGAQAAGLSRLPVADDALLDAAEFPRAVLGAARAPARPRTGRR